MALITMPDHDVPMPENCGMFGHHRLKSVSAASQPASKFQHPSLRLQNEKALEAKAAL